MEKTVEELLYYAEYHLGLKKRDENYVRNLLMEKLRLKNKYDGEIDKIALENLTVPDCFLERISEYAKSSAL